MIANFQLKKELKKLDKKNYLTVKESLDKYDDDNLSFLKINNNIEEYKLLFDTVNENIKITSKEDQKTFSTSVISSINLLSGSGKYFELPKLKYGKSLSDEEFISLLKECISFANYNLPNAQIEKMKNKLLYEYYSTISNLFKYPQIIKDLMENALLTILTSNNEDDQEDNYELLKIKDCTMTPFIQLDFKHNTLNREELTRIFCSNIYILNYVQTLNDFLPESNKKVNEKEIKTYIENYFLNHNRNIYFCILPERMMAISIHTGNIYLKARYLEEYYNEEAKNPQIIIREKIILNLGHEINHILLREISDSMSQNFLIKSKCKNKNKNNNNNSELIFVNKFDSKRTHKFNMDESGDYFDFFFFNKFYFDTLYLNEANFFFEYKKYYYT